MIETRRPTGLPLWPLMLIAGMPSSGKTRMCAVASASPLVSRTYWLSYGELDPDEYYAIPGADFDLVVHDGTVADVVRIVDEIAAMPVPDDGPALIVIDGGSKVWGVIGEEVRQAKQTRTGAETDGDLWTDAKGDWQALVEALRRHRGPALLTARLEETVVHGVDGKPTAARSYRIKAEKDLAYDVDAVIEMRARGDFVLTKANSEQIAFEGRRSWPDFTVHDFWIAWGLGDGVTSPKSYVKPVPLTEEAADRSGRNWLSELAKAYTADAAAALLRDATAAKATKATIASIRAKQRSFSRDDIPSAG